MNLNLQNSNYRKNFYLIENLKIFVSQYKKSKIKMFGGQIL